LDPSKTGKGILASLEHKAVEPSRCAASASAPGRGSALAVAGGTVVAALLAWWLYGGPSPVILHETLPPPEVRAASIQAPQPGIRPLADNGVAAIVDEAPQPLAVSPASPALAAVPAPVPAAMSAAVLKRERVAVPRPHAKPKPKQLPLVREPVRRTPRAAPDTDVALLSALVAHANARDVVEPHGSDSTESLLQRCRRVGGEEGRLCRLRICASRAGDGACQGD
jgi:hypothetical protein